MSNNIILEENQISKSKLKNFAETLVKCFSSIFWKIAFWRTVELSYRHDENLEKSHDEWLSVIYKVEISTA